MGEPEKKVSSGAPIRPVLRFLKRRRYPVITDDPTPDATMSDLEPAPYLEHAQFNNAFAGTPLDVLNGVGFDNSYIDGDLNAFYVALHDPSRKSSDYVEVDWFTDSLSTLVHRAPDVDPGPSKLVLFKVEPGRFLSRPLILVNNQDDCDDSKNPANGGLPPDHPLFARFGGPRTKKQPNYRIRRVGMRQWVHVVYRDRDGVVLDNVATDMYGPNRFHFDVHVFVLRERRGGAPVAESKHVLAALEFSLQCYERVGYWMATDINPANAATDNAEVVRVSGKVDFQYLVIEPPLQASSSSSPSPAVDPWDVTTEGAAAVAAKYPPRSPHTLRLFVIGSLRSGAMNTDLTDVTLGVSQGPSDRLLVRMNLEDLPKGQTEDTMLPPVLDGTSWVETIPKGTDERARPAANEAFVWTFAHELGHLLMDKAAFLIRTHSPTLNRATPTFLFAHFRQPSIVRGARLLGSLNLMHLAGSPKGIGGAKRLWLQADGDGFSQVDAIRRWPAPP